MKNYFKNKSIYFLLSCLLILSSCSSLPKKVNGLSTSKTKGPIFIHLRGLQDYESKSRLFSKVMVSEKEGEKITVKETKYADFDVKSEILLVDRGKALLYFVLKTIRSEGDMDLTDLAMPELNKELKITLYPNAEVFEVEDKPKTSIFYVPPISLPLNKVKVGDAWKFKRIWLTAKTGVPVQIDMETTFKHLLKCGDGVCVDLEFNGKVSLPTADISKLHMLSDMRGRILFSLTTGSVLWSDVTSKEEISINGKTQIVESCTRSALFEPVAEKLVDQSQLKCDPKKNLEKKWTLLKK